MNVLPKYNVWSNSPVPQLHVFPMKHLGHHNTLLHHLGRERTKQFQTALKNESFGRRFHEGNITSSPLSSRAAKKKKGTLARLVQIPLAQTRRILPITVRNTFKSTTILRCVPLPQSSTRLRLLEYHRAPSPPSLSPLHTPRSEPDQQRS